MDAGGIAVPLFIVFLVLKLIGKINWSWWWVTAPLWGDVALTVFLFAVLPLLGLSAFGVFKRIRRSRRG